MVTQNYRGFTRNLVCQPVHQRGSNLKNKESLLEKEIEEYWIALNSIIALAHHERFSTNERLDNIVEIAEKAIRKAIDLRFD